MRFKSNINKNVDKGVAGLTILLSLVTMLFVIGLLVMIFSLMGGELQTATSQTITVSTNETITISGLGISSEVSSSDECGFQGWTPTAVYNCTSDGVADCSETGGTNETLALTTDYTVNANGSIMNVTDIYTPLSVTYTYLWGGEACEVINDTTVAISTVTDWFDIFIVIGAMVVLILLTVIIVTAIRGSGMLGGTGSA